MAQVRPTPAAWLASRATACSLARARRVWLPAGPRRRGRRAGHRRHRGAGRRGAGGDRPGCGGRRRRAARAAAAGDGGTVDRRRGRHRWRRRPRGRATTPPPAAPRPAAATASRTRPASPTTTITLANISDISGPVPGIFESAQEATRAYVAYFNADQRHLRPQARGGAARQPRRRRRRPAGLHQGLRRGVRRGRVDVGVRLRRRGDRRAAAACPTSARPTVNPERRDCATCFAAQAVDPGDVPSAVPRTSSKNKRRHPERRDALHQRRCGAGQRRGVPRGAGARRLEDRSTSRASTSRSSTTRRTSSR